MKRYFVLVFLLFTGLSLFAQTFREARIFVLPVDGEGGTGDNAYFYRQINYEVVLQFHSLVSFQREADYILRGTIGLFTGQFETPVFQEDTDALGPVPPRPIPPVRNTFGRREYFSWEVDGSVYFYDTTGDGNYQPVSMYPMSANTQQDDGDAEYVFNLELVESATGEVVGNQYLIYSTVDSSVNPLISIIVYNMLAGIPDFQEDSSDWRDKSLFFNISALWAPRIYADQRRSVNMPNFGFGLSAEYNFVDFMSVGLGLQFVQDRVVFSSARSEEYRDLILEIPASLMFVFRLADHFTLEPYAGVALNFSLMRVTHPSVFSWFTGLQFGMKAGSGMITFDPRFAMDFYHSTANSREYHRYMLQIGIGYKFGFFPKRAP